MGWISHWGSDYYSDVMESYGEAQVNNAIIIYSYLIERGFRHNAICAMLGNMMTESYLNPGQWQHGYSPYDGNSSNGFGLVGWTPYWRITDWLNDKGYNLSNADSYGYGMLDKLIEECFNPQEVTWIPTDTYNISFEEFAKDTTHSISWLALAFLKNYERPYDGNQPQRATQALKWNDILLEHIQPYKPRLTDDGMIGSKYYYSENVFYLSGYGLPNCTAYAWGRRYEITDIYPSSLSTSDAKNWYPHAISVGDAVGKTPKLGAIACWYYDNGGHVAVVEVINDDGSIVVSESAWGGTYFFTETIYPDDNGDYTPQWVINNFGGYFQGFIYNPYAPIPTPIPTPSKKKKGMPVWMMCRYGL